MKINPIFLLIFAGVCCIFDAATAQQPTTTPNPELTGLRAIGSPANPKVKWVWNKYDDNAALLKFCQEMAKQHPDLVKYESIGKSVEGRDILVLTVTDTKTGDPARKPGFYIDGNIHANELQGTQFAMYTAWYLAENFANVAFIKTMLQEKVFYILPTLNPDGHDNFIYKPNNANSPRSGLLAIDNDGDGEVNEDGYDDLDNDGNIVMMRRRSATGRWKVDCDDPNRMIPAKADEKGGYEMLGYEGIDNDGDGAVNEDGDYFQYDPNRDWGWGWQPNYIQNGAMYYPGSLPETQALKKFVYAHANIAGGQMYHNYGGMFLRGPGAEEDQQYYSQSDISVYDVIGKTGEKMIPGYNYFTLYKDLYTVYGGEIDWLSLGRGVFVFSNEIMTSYRLFNKKSDENRFSNNEFNEFDRLMLFGDGIIPWKKITHPQYGEIEIGGTKKNYVRNTPGFMLEEEGHRNMAFTLFHAYHLPKLEILDIKKKALAGGLLEVTATVVNNRAIPTHSAHDIKFKIERPDYIGIKGGQVLAGMIVDNEDLNLTRDQKNNPAVIEVPNIGGTISGGFGSSNTNFVKVRWILKATAATPITINVDSQKGGVLSKTE